MPELPEVETVRRSLARHLLGATITRCEILHPKLHRLCPGAEEWLQQAVITAVERRAKLLFFRFVDRADVLAVHLKMTGQFILQAGTVRAGGGHSDSRGPDRLPNSHTRAIFHLQTKSGESAQLYFNDQRLFAYFKRLTPTELQTVLSAYGAEPGTDAFTYDVFATALGKRQAPLKAVLLDQSKIAGLGNIYVDEACYRAKVRPTRRAARLTQSERKALWKACAQVIEEAVAVGGTTFRNYQDIDGRMGGFVDKLRVYGRQGLACLRCKIPHIITKVVCAGRGTHYCSHCQV
jgi:formamidopyrimidine-DNA glycosylase